MLRQNVTLTHCFLYVPFAVCMFKLLWQMLQIVKFDGHFSVLILLVCGDPKKTASPGMNVVTWMTLFTFLALSLAKCHTVSVYLKPHPEYQYQAACNFLKDRGCPWLCNTCEMSKLFRNGYMTLVWLRDQPYSLECSSNSKPLGTLCCVVLSDSGMSDSEIPRTIACKAPLSMGILQAGILEWVAMPSSRGSSQPRVKLRPPTL